MVAQATLRPVHLGEQLTEVTKIVGVSDEASPPLRAAYRSQLASTAHSDARSREADRQRDREQPCAIS